MQIFTLNILYIILENAEHRYFAGYGNNIRIARPWQCQPFLFNMVIYPYFAFIR